jgi:hypothetical protein
MDTSTIFKLYTLVDITATGIRNDSSQQNFLTVQNTISLRANPTILRYPELVDNFPKFGTKFKEAKKVWRLVFEIEYGQHDLELLKEDFEIVPFIANLGEDAKFEHCVFRTSNRTHSNILFTQDDKYS